MTSPGGFSNGGADEEGARRNQPNNRWFNDRRFNFGPSASVGRLRQHMNQFLTDMNQTARQNPELLGQLRTQLQAISDLINAHQGQDTTTNTTAIVHQASQATLPIIRQNSEPAAIGQGGFNQGRSVPRGPFAVNNDGQSSSRRVGEVVLDLGGHSDMNFLEESIPESANDESLEEEVGAEDSTVQNQPSDPVPGNQAQQTEEAAEQDDWQRISELLQSPEMQRVIKILLAIVPFVLIVFFKMFIDHFTALFTLTVFVLLFYYGNKTLARFVSERAAGKAFDAFKVMVVLNAGLSNLYLFFREEKLWLSLLFQAPPQLEFADHVDLCVVLWIVLSTDFVVKFGGMIMKASVGLVPRKVLGFKRKRNVYQWIEYSSQLYRHLLPIVPWWYYLLSTHSRHGFIMGISFTLDCVYLAIKGAQTAVKVKRWRKSTAGLFQMNAYGTKASSSDLYTAGPTCSICYGDYKDPLILSCKHVFCEECISTWLDGEKSCPMCRAEVSKEDVSWKCGSTTWLLQVF